MIDITEACAIIIAAGGRVWLPANAVAVGGNKRVKTAKARNRGARQWQIRADEPRTDPFPADVQAAMDAPRDRYGNPLPDARTHQYGK